ncbi:hypothetical protein ONS95_006628 [Cadophora gregata]|uniref:uncharacterized protein n=1 Tax=Cadophora gregata TaxID=51156 RepID=UPI0026DC1626|nr:uncharacterized protein ONS95_006628 [Cadophora gregata]KAK0101456.1 hypothetical protein ONS95_006628 [Cadophora gregata]
MGEINDSQPESEGLSHTKEDATTDAVSYSNVNDHEAQCFVEGQTAYSKLSVTSMVVFSGLAIGSDGFNASIIGNLSLIFGVLYPGLSTVMYSRLSNAFLIGMIVGMLGFGYISDRLGRKSGAVLTTFILVMGIALSAASSGKDQLGMFWMLVISRGIAGVGAGGYVLESSLKSSWELADHLTPREYPVSGAGATEATDEDTGTRKHRGFIFALIADLSATLGFVFGGLVPLLLILCFHSHEKHYNIVWRLALALGAIPPLSIFWFRYKMAVSTAYRKSAAKKQRVPYWPILKRYWRPLLGCSISWFLYSRFWLIIPHELFTDPHRLYLISFRVIRLNYPQPLEYRLLTNKRHGLGNSDQLFLHSWCIYRRLPL